MRTKYKSKFYFTAGFLLPAIILAISFALRIPIIFLFWWNGI